MIETRRGQVLRTVIPIAVAVIAAVVRAPDVERATAELLALVDG